MKVLTLWEPWATLYAHGIKKIETRPKPTTYRGTYLIHSANRWTRFQKELCEKEPFKSELEKIWYLWHDESLNKIDNPNFNFGCIIGAVEIISCARIASFFGKPIISLYDWYREETIIKQPELSFGDYTNGRYAWIGENHRLLKTPISYKGQQGYYSEFKGDKSQLIFK